MKVWEWILQFVKWRAGWWLACFLFFKLYLIVSLYSGFLLCLFEFSIKIVGGGPTASHFSFWWDILRGYFSCLNFTVKVVGGGPTCQSLFFACAKKSNQKKAHNLTKIDPDITYSLWDGFNQYTLTAPTKTFFTRPSCSSESNLASSQYHSDSSDFSKHNEATTNKFSRLLFILEQVKNVPNGRFLLLSSACRSKEKKKKE